MSTISDVLDDVRSQIDADEEALREARNRLELVRDAASSYPGALRTYRSGSLAVHTMLDPVNDGDGGLVLDRRFHQSLGPEGRGELPSDVASDLQRTIGPTIRNTYPGARIDMSKRGPFIHFNAPLANGQDPTVDLVIALTRKDGTGLWIPNLDANKWEPSDPEKHAELLNSGSASYRSIRRRVIRLAKAWNNQFPKPCVSSFMLSVWALEYVAPGMGVSNGLFALFEGATMRVANGQSTPDPAGVSKPLKYLLPDFRVESMLRSATRALEDAFDAGDDEHDVRAALADMYPDYLGDTRQKSLKTAASTIARLGTVSAASMGVTGAATAFTPGRSFGGQ
ncbi:nucleotidyltransferase family protein [Leifsonia aquatica]|uniref:hypothetical protein n=1 Tax=Leifsonia aquatica TaxID=144185 RepID=UPI003812278C